MGKDSPGIGLSHSSCGRSPRQALATGTFSIIGCTPSFSAEAKGSLLKSVGNFPACSPLWMPCPLPKATDWDATSDGSNRRLPNYPCAVSHRGRRTSRRHRFYHSAAVARESHSAARPKVVLFSLQLRRRGQSRRYRYKRPRLCFFLGECRRLPARAQRPANHSRTLRFRPELWNSQVDRGRRFPWNRNPNRLAAAAAYGRKGVKRRWNPATISGSGLGCVERSGKSAAQPLAHRRGPMLFPISAVECDCRRSFSVRANFNEKTPATARQDRSRPAARANPTPTPVEPFLPVPFHAPAAQFVQSRPGHLVSWDAGGYVNAREKALLP